MLLAIDIGGTKVAFALFSEDGEMLPCETLLIDKREGDDAGMIISGGIERILKSEEKKGSRIKSAGISVPGICHAETGRVWAPNIKGWEDYPLLEKTRDIAGDIPVVIDSDRACSILGEYWMGNARGCSDAVFLAVGTGIGAGILAGGEVLRGNNDIAGAVGWMALGMPFKPGYERYGCFEYNASGDGIARVTRDFLKENPGYSGILKEKEAEEITSHDVFSAYDEGDSLAWDVMKHCITFWGMAVANIVSIFNPEKVILGGGVFGPAARFISEIKAEAERWAQPISIRQVSIEPSALGGNAAVYGAGFLSLRATRRGDKSRK